MQSAISKLEGERAEVDALLSSRVLGRKNNLVRLLTFVCEKYFDGAADEVKEYSIAVHALGRPESFDPQVDTIVRVSAHALRKRLEDYYRSEGAEHAVHICLPPGHYIPKFIHKNEIQSERSRLELRESRGIQPQNEAGGPQKGFLEARQQTDPGSIHGSALRGDVSAGNEGLSSRKLKFPATVVKIAAILVFSASVLSVLAWHRWNRTGSEGSNAAILAAAAPLNGSVRALRAMAAGGLRPYVDRSGSAWESDRFCSGGSTFSVIGHAIQGTEDPQLFSTGRRGIFHCMYPVAPGTYEVRLMFAETFGLQENSRAVGFSINDGPIFNLDVVDDAGGDDIATTKVFVDVAPENDGTIHLDFNTPEAFLNAVEILPGTPHHALPARIVVGHSPYRDPSGNVWLSDRYFFGGRVSSFGGDLSKVRDGRLYEWHRFGHFHYVVPVASGSKYTVRLYFVEHWFGVQNGGIGGAGSRVFDVSCNGTMLLKAFDIFREAGSQPLVKSFPHIEPTPQGKIELYFTPAVNYPSVSAIEVIPE